MEKIYIFNGIDEKEVGIEWWQQCIRHSLLKIYSQIGSYQNTQFVITFASLRN